ncbi:MAG: ribonuclease P protein component [Candidatus Pacebacteria bacterium]|nr:ribonuclease P protein component [Candidatus Paceibacterota bacterium]
MLKKRNRLTRHDFEHLLKNGRRVHGERVTIVFEKVSGISHTADTPSSTSYKLQATSSPALRAGAVVSKKVSRKAVARNKMRRMVYHLLGELLPTNENMHIAVFTRPGILTASHEDLRREIKALLLKIYRS